MNILSQQQLSLNSVTEPPNVRRTVGMILYASDNYGSCATNYSLCKAVEDSGYIPLLLDAQIPMFGISASYLPLHFLCTSALFPKNNYNLNNICDSFVLGSDYSLNIVSWHTAKYIEYFLMAFVEERKRKIAYAPSLGLPDVEHDLCLRYLYASLLKRFQLITFREKSAVEICEKFFGLSSEHVLDPVFLIDKQKFTSIIPKQDIRNPCKEYLLAYIIDYGPERVDFIKKIAKRLGIEYKIVLDGRLYETPDIKDMMQDVHIVKKPTFEEWLCLFASSSFVVTDSFHGTCFAIIFHKNYISIKNRNTLRFDSLGDLLGHEEDLKRIHIYKNIDEALNDPENINNLPFAQYDSVIACRRVHCLDLLRKALSVDLTHHTVIENDGEKEGRLHYVTLWKHNYFLELNNKQLLSTISFKTICWLLLKRCIRYTYTKLFFAKVVDILFPKFSMRRQYIVKKIRILLKCPK